jgi:hypothetical protein
MKQHLRAACRDIETPEKFRPEGFEYQFSYFSPYTIATAFDHVTRQLSFIEERQRRYGKG